MPTVSRLTILLICLLVAMGAFCGSVHAGKAGTGEAKERFPAGDLRQYKHELLDYYPPTVCAVKNLLGDEYRKISDNEYEGGTSGVTERWEETVDPSGGVVDANSNYQNDDKRMLWVHPDGSIVVGLRRDEGRKVLMFTNNATLVHRPPAPVRIFLQEMLKGGSKHKVKWKAPKENMLVFPEKCSAASMADKVKAYADARQGRSCEVSNLGNIRFLVWPHAVFPKDKSGKTYLHKAPTKNETPARKLPYLVAGDLVDIMEIDFKPKITNGFVCVFYRSAKGRISMGWVANGDLVDVWNSEPSRIEFLLRTLPAQSWFPKATDREHVPGRYVKDHKRQSELRFRLLTDGSLRVSGIREDMDIKYNTDRQESIVIKTFGPRIAKGRRGTPPDGESVDVYLFNNAIGIHGEEFHENFWGDFYP